MKAFLKHALKDVLKKEPELLNKPVELFKVLNNFSENKALQAVVLQSETPL